MKLPIGQKAIIGICLQGKGAHNFYVKETIFFLL